jgi:hypothetical protein
MGDTCRSCGAAIVWAKMIRDGVPTGKTMPVDAGTDPKGTVWLYGGDDDPKATVLTGLELENARFTAAPLRLSHFATCPQSREWKKS